MDVAALNADYCATLVDELVHQGLRHAVVAPGSRSAPLALALVRDGRIGVEVVLDTLGRSGRAIADLQATARRITGTPAGPIAAALAPPPNPAIPAARPPTRASAGTGSCPKTRSAAPASHRSSKG